MAINLTWLNPFLFPKPSVFHRLPTIISSSSQTGEATSEKLMERRRMNGRCRDDHYKVDN